MAELKVWNKGKLENVQGQLDLSMFDLVFCPSLGKMS